MTPKSCINGTVTYKDINNYNNGGKTTETRDAPDTYRTVKQGRFWVKTLAELWSRGGIPMAMKIEKGKYKASKIEINVYIGTWVNTPQIARDYTLTVYSKPGMTITDASGKSNMKHVTVGGSPDYSVYTEHHQEE